MFRNAHRPPLRLHAPLQRLVLCLDCDACFEIGDASCPACGGRSWNLLAKFIAWRQAPADFVAGTMDHPAIRR